MTTILQLHRDGVYPPSNGEEVRIWETAKKLSELGTVWVATPSSGDAEQRAENDRANITLAEFDNPLLAHKASRIYAWNAWLASSADNALDRTQARRTVREVEGFDVDFDVVVCESPQMLRASYRLADRHDAALVLNKHNAMFDLLDQQLGTRPIPDLVRRRAVRNLRTLEQWGIDRADAVVFQSHEDRERFRLPETASVAVIPNGTNVAEIVEGGDPEALRGTFGLSPDATVCLFVGACDYEPNAEAAETIVEELAPALPDVEFLIVGRDPPRADRENVHTPGFVDDLPGALSLADVALCPLTLGSGTKLKVMDYLAAGLPIVTTEVGAQGIPLEDGETALIRSTPEGFVRAIRTLADTPSLRSSLASNAAALGKRYSWESLLADYELLIRELLEEESALSRSSSPT